MVLPGMKKKRVITIFCYAVYWYKNKTIIYRSDFSSVDYDYELDVGKK